MENSCKKDLLEKWAPRFCAVCLLMPVFVLLISTSFPRAENWLDADHPIRALVVVSLVLAISWASHSLGLGVAHPRFWSSCMIFFVLVFLSTAVLDYFGWKFSSKGKEFATMLILMACPVVLLIAQWVRKRG